MCKNLLSDHLHNYSIKKFQIPFKQKTPCHNIGNSRNGLYERALHTEFGALHLVIPHDRNGDFKQQTVAPYKKPMIRLKRLLFICSKRV